MKRLLVSYIRWSTKEQGAGDSLNRQQSLIDSYYSKHQDIFYMSQEHRYIDEGRSGFKQANKDASADYTRLLNNIASGSIPKGSLLICENLDRISRADIDTAIDDVKSLIRSGVDVLTLSDNELYDSKSLRDPIKLIKQILISERAHSESLLKQERISAAWKAKHEKAISEGVILTKATPGWISSDKTTNTFSLIPEKAEIVRDIFNMRLSGVSMFSIAKRLNDKNTPPINDRQARISKTFKPGNGNWSGVSVKHVLTSRSVLGHLPATNKRPEIPNYYPPVIDLQTFNAVQTLISEGGKGRSPENKDWIHTNIFKGLLTCACGLSLKVTGIRGNYQGIYRCHGAVDGRCNHGTVSRKLLDTALCSRLLSQLTRIYNDSDDKQLINSLESSLEAVERELTILTETLLQLPNITQIRDKLAEKQIEKNKLKQSLDEIKARLSTVTPEDMSLSSLNLETVEGRTEAHIIIKRLIKQITVSGKDKTVDVLLHNGNEITGFQLDGNSDQTLTLNRVSDTDELNMITGDYSPLVIQGNDPEQLEPLP